MTRAALLLSVVVGLAFGAGPGGFWGGGPGGLPSGFTLAGTIQALNLTATNNVATNDLAVADSSVFTGAVTMNAGFNAMGTLCSTNSYMAGVAPKFFGPTTAASVMQLYAAGYICLGAATNTDATMPPTRSLGAFSTGLSNLIQSPDFAAASGWTLTGTAISGGKLNKLTAAGAGTATQAVANLPVVASSVYLIRLDVDSLSAGHDIVVTMGGTTFGTLTAEGANQWMRGTTVNATGVFSIAWGDGETGIVDNVYCYRLAPKLQVGGSLWNVAEVSTAATYTVLDGQHVLSIGHADSCVVTLPALSACFDVLTNMGREIVIENTGTGFCVITTPAGDASLNAIAGADSLHLAQYAVATLRAISATHWAVAE